MKNIGPASLGVSAILTAAVGLAGCGSVTSSSAAPELGHHIQTQPSQPATVAYVFGQTESGVGAMLQYSTAPGNNSSPVASLQAPQGSIATDSTGQIYIAAGDIFVYPPNSTGNARPSRIIHLDYFANRIAIDPTGRIYALDFPDGWTAGASMPVDVYAADARGVTKLLRSILLTNVLPPVLDMAADAAGNL